MTNGEIVLAVIGGIMAVAQAMAFFILTDMRERIMRLEDKQWKPRTPRGGYSEAR